MCSALELYDFCAICICVMMCVCVCVCVREMNGLHEKECRRSAAQLQLETLYLEALHCAVPYILHPLAETVWKRPGLPDLQKNNQN